MLTQKTKSYFCSSGARAGGRFGGLRSPAQCVSSGGERRLLTAGGDGEIFSFGASLSSSPLFLMVSVRSSAAAD